MGSSVKTSLLNLQEFPHIPCSKSRYGHHLSSLQRGHTQDMVVIHGPSLLRDYAVAICGQLEVVASPVLVSEPWA